jgi:hypothetical protein
LADTDLSGSAGQHFSAAHFSGLSLAKIIAVTMLQQRS